MVTAEQDEVVERRRPAVGPVLDVVGVDEAMALTAGELATAVAGREGSADRRRDRATLAADRDWLAVLLDQRNEG